MPKTDRIRALLQPRSIAIIGASSDSSKQSGRPLANLLQYGYEGPIYPVNPRHQQVMGLKAYPSLTDIGQPIDLTIVMTPASEVVDAVAQGIQAGSRAFAIYASGFAELDAQGRHRQEALLALARKHDVAILGPNCNGVINTHARMCATMAGINMPELRTGPVAFVGQSGAMAAYWLQILVQDNFGFSTWLPTGNEADLGIDDFVTYLVGDAATRAICIYIEGVRDGPALRRALESAQRANKPVLALRAGRTALGAAAALSHTGAMAAQDQVWSALFEQTGVLAFDSLREMIDAAKLISSEPLPSAGRALVLSVSGGGAALISDAAEPKGIELPPISEQTLPALTAALPSFGKVGNPLDLTGSCVINTAIFVDAAKAVCHDPAFDSFVLYFGLISQGYQSIIDAIIEHLLPTGKPVLVIWVAAQPQVIAALRKARLAFYEDIPQAIGALAAWNTISARQPVQGNGLAPGRPRLSCAGSFLSEVRGCDALGQVQGLTWPIGRLITHASQLDEALRGLKFPLVAKIQSAQLPHKTEHGGIVLSLGDAISTRAAVDDLFKRAIELDLALDGILVQEMVQHEHELIVGIRQDPVFGALLLLGRGGVESQDQPDTCLRLLPVTAHEIEAALITLRMTTRLKGWRGRPAVDLKLLADCIFELTQRVAARPELLEVEFNPLAVTAPDRFVALDALVTRADPGAAASSSS
jgi:acyl-CoA synthetase (NDP forming)